MKQSFLKILAKYRAQVEALLAELENVPAERLARKPADGGWSAIQTLQHLVLVEKASLAYVRKKLSFNPKLEKGGIRAWLGCWKLWAIWTLKIPMNAPDVVGAAEKLPNDASLADVRQNWQQSHADWQVFFETMPDELADKAVYKHPYAGRLGWGQMLDFLWMHLNRHKNQIWRAIKA